MPSDNYLPEDKFSIISDTLNLSVKVSRHGIVKKTKKLSVPFSAHLFVILILKVCAVKLCTFEKQPAGTGERFFYDEDLDLSV